MKKVKVSKIFTMSKYIDGMHYTHGCDWMNEGNFSFAESLSPLNFMIEELGKKGVLLGKKVKVTMEVL